MFELTFENFDWILNNEIPTFIKIVCEIEKKTDLIEMLETEFSNIVCFKIPYIFKW